MHPLDRRLKPCGYSINFSKSVFEINLKHIITNFVNLFKKNRGYFVAELNPDKKTGLRKRRPAKTVF